MSRLTLASFALLSWIGSAMAADLYSSLPAVEKELHAAEAARRRSAIDKLDAFSEKEVRALLVAALGDADPEVRAHAAESLGRHRALAARSALVKALADPEPLVRAKAIEALPSCAPRGTDELTVSAKLFEHLLTDPDGDVRLATLGVLHRSPSLSAHVDLSALLGRLDDEQAEVRRRAVDLLGALRDRRAMVALLPRLSDTVAEVRAAAVEALAALGDTRLVAPLARLLGDPSDEVRDEALLGLGRLGGEGAVETLAQLVRTGSRPLRGRALSALGQIVKRRPAAADSRSGPEPDLALETLFWALSQTELRPAAEGALATAGKPALSRLLARFASFDGTEEERHTLFSLISTSGDVRALPLVLRELRLRRLPREELVDALGILVRSAGSDGDEAVVTLLGLVADPDPILAHKALRALSGVADRRAASVLVAAAASNDPAVVALALPELGRLQIKEAVPTIERALGQSNAQVAEAAARALGVLAEATSPAHLIEALVEALKRTEAPVRRAAADALMRLHPAGAEKLLWPLLKRSGTGQLEAIDALSAIVRGRGPGPGHERGDKVSSELLLGLVEGKEPLVSDAALDALAAMRDPTTAARLLRLLDRSVASTRKRIVAALGNQLPSPASQASIDRALIHCLAEDVDPSVRAEAAWALGKRPSAPSEAALVAALGAEDPSVRSSAAAALTRLVRGQKAVVEAQSSDDPITSENAKHWGQSKAGTDFVYLRLLDFDGAPLPNAPYRLRLPDGLVKQGTSDARGLVREELVPAGRCILEIIDRPDA